MEIKAELFNAIELANQGNWDQAHKIVQSIENKYAYWIHANLHREEGDDLNSKYWYSKAELPYCDCDFKKERKIIFLEIEKNFRF